MRPSNSEPRAGVEPMTWTREVLLMRLGDGEWHSEVQLASSSSGRGLDAWIRLLRLSGYEIDERSREGSVEYRLVPPR